MDRRRRLATAETEPYMVEETPKVIRLHVQGCNVSSEDSSTETRAKRTSTPQSDATVKNIFLGHSSANREKSPHRKRSRGFFIQSFLTKNKKTVAQ
jgi:hypothetical protein